MVNMQLFLNPETTVHKPTILCCYDGSDIYYGLQWFGMRTNGDVLDKQFIFPINIEPQILDVILDELEVLMIGQAKDCLNEKIRSLLIQNPEDTTTTVLHFVDRSMQTMQRGKLRFREMAVSLNLKISDDVGILEPRTFINKMLRDIMYK